MKISTLAVVAGPPVAVGAAIALLNPAVLTWPVMLVLVIVFGAIGAVAQNMLDPSKEN